MCGMTYSCVQRTATHWNVLKYIATYYNTLPYKYVPRHDERVYNGQCVCVCCVYVACVYMHTGPKFDF